MSVKIYSTVMRQFPPRVFTPLGPKKKGFGEQSLLNGGAGRGGEFQWIILIKKRTQVIVERKVYAKFEKNWPTLNCVF